MKNITFYLFILLVSALSAQQNITTQGKRDSLSLTKEEWIADIRYFAENFKSQHKNPYTKYPADTFDKKINRIIQKIELANKVNPTDIILGIQGIIWLTGDSHSAINIGNNVILKHYPLNINAFGNAYYIIGTLPENKEYLGNKIISYNGIPIDSVIKKISGLFYFDNTSWTKNRVPSYLISHDILQHLGIVETDLRVKVANKNGETKELILKPAKMRDFMRSIVYIQRRSKPETEENNGLYYWKKVINSKILFVQYNQCKTYDKSVSEAIQKDISSKKDLPMDRINFALNNMIPFHNFSDSIMALLSKGGIKTLVFDMRYNSGGNSELGAQLIEKISKNEKINKNGKLYVIIGRKTFSSAILNTIDFKNKTNAILIGEPTGGKPNHFGEVKSFSLPNSRFVINYSTKYFEHLSGNPYTIEPDVIIEQTLDDYINGVDPSLEYVLKLK